MAAEEYGKYQLIKRLATGGMAQIYLARQKGPEGFEKLLVVKRILPHLAENEEFITMFLDEAKIAARLNHPNVVQIFDLGAQDDTYFIAMEYIHGEDVRRVWKRAEACGRELPVPLVCRVIIDACSGLDYAHRKADQSGRPLGIVHRDISPQNILVTFEGGVKVVDFGIAKAADQATVTRSGVLKGKYSYMSPEQASGKRLDCRSDIFALGVVLYELLTGTRLFKRSNDIQTLNAVTECKVALPSEVNPRLPPDLDAVVMKALTRDPDDRYQEAVGLQVALEDWLLANQLPSSSVHLAGFMSEIYTERLAREAAEGNVLVDELDSSKAKEEELSPQKNRATPSLPSVSRATGRSQRSAPRPEPRDVESTTADRPDRGVARSGSGTSRTRSLEKRAEAPPDRREQPPTRPSRPAVPRVKTPLDPIDPPSPDRPQTEVSRARASGGGAKAFIAAAVLAALGVVGYLLLGPQPETIATPLLRIESVPPGASVVLDGKPLPQKTPCTSPALPPGDYSLRVTLAGYRDYQTRVAIPAQGRPELPLIRLEPLREPVLVEDPVEQDSGAAAFSQVQLLVRSEPSGASLLVGGEPRGRTPVEFEARSGDSLTLRFALAGHKELERKLEVGLRPTQELLVSLERVRRVEHRPPPDDPIVSDPPPRGTGLLRVMVQPWAEVTCGNHQLGQTPFKDKPLPAGEYDCKFTNPELGTKTQHVVVKANATTVVTEKF